MTDQSSSSRLNFTARDRQRLAEAAAHARNVRLFRRLQAVLRVAEGFSVQEAARQADVDRASVHRWVRQYLASRLPSDLAEAARSGRPRVAPALDDTLLEQLLAQDPRTLGYRATSWTAPLLATHWRKTYGDRLSERTVRRRLRQYDWRWKRPRHVYHQRAANVAQKKGRLSAASNRG